jgi:lantibiotic biosynthesis protein
MATIHNRALIIEKIDDIYNILSKHTPTENGILDGKAGNLLFCYEYEKILRDKNFTTVNSSFLELLESINGTNPSFSSGIAGINFTLKHIINDDVFDEEDKEVLKELTQKYDLSLLDYLIESKDREYSDFLHGEFGILWAIYCNSDLYKTSEFQEYTMELVKGLNLDKNGYFLTTPKPWHEKASKVVNMGLSHGIPSSLVTLSKCINTTNEKKEKLLSSMVSFIFKYKQEDSFYFFPIAIIDGKAKYTPRFAWCYGDLGVAISLWISAKALNQEMWKQQAIDIFLYSSKRRDLEENGVNDAGFCHGTAGIAHIFNRMYWETKNPIFKETANYWIEETLKMAYHEDGLAGYKSLVDDGWVNDYGFLEGLAGIGLALLAHISDEEPAWDRCLLLS